MKRILTLCALVLAVVLAISACGSSKKATTNTTAASAKPGHTVTVSTDTTPSSTSEVATSPEGVAGTGGATLATLGRPFSASSPWNTKVLNAAVAPNTNTLMIRAETRYGVVTSNADSSLEDLKTQKRILKNPLFVNTTIWTDPIVFTTGADSVTLTCRQINLPPPHNDCGDGWDLKSLPIPVTSFPKPSYDGWLTVIDRSTGFAYDFWRARFTSGNSVLSYQFVRRWDLNGTGFLAPGYVGARGSGLPLFAGEILPRDISSGRINHALAMSVPGPASTYYVQPASSTDGNGESDSLPEGARIKLKPTVDINAVLAKLPGLTNLTAARAIMVALKTYGAIIVDRGAVPTVYAVPNYNWNQYLRNSKGALLSPNGRTVLPKALQIAKKYGTPLLSGNVVAGLTLDDFEVVQLPQVLQYPPLPNTTEIGGLNGVEPQAVDGKGTTDSTQITQGQNSSSAIDGSVP